MAPRGKRVEKKKPSRPAKIRKLKEVVFDEDARKEYLTGFSKRKKARELAVRTKAIGREKEEARENRKVVRDERKERAALNVRNAKELYGDNDLTDSEVDNSNGDSSDEDDADPSAPKASTSTQKSRAEAAYESAELITTVVIEDFTLSRSASPVSDRGSSPEAGGGEPRKKTTGAGGGGTGEKHKKRVRNKPAYRPKMTREDKKARATGGKKVKASFVKGNSGTKARANNGK
ncbi:hypothetical protein RQP46_000090 [Phenoliferia psychrophenolica]